jgi:PAS domain S-box-containing protein
MRNAASTGKVPPKDPSSRIDKSSKRHGQLQMQNSNLTLPSAFDPEVAELAETGFQAVRLRSNASADRLFSVLMPLQWAVGVALAGWRWHGSPQAGWHPEIWNAVALGAAVNGFPLWVLWSMSACVAARQAIGVGQMLACALLIHLSGGRADAHFLEFGSLALLALYRDWRLLWSAAATSAAWHFAGGLLWPALVYGAGEYSIWRSVEHASWLAATAMPLAWLSRRSLASVREACQARAALQAATERTEALIEERTAQLSAAEKRFRTICDSLGVGLFELDAAGRCTYANPAFASHLQRDIGEIAGDGWFTFIQPEDRARLAKAGLHRFDGAVRFLRADGEEREGWIQLRPARSANAGTALMIGTLADVTERKRAERELVQAREAAEAASRVKSDFLASVGHELRTPMNGIIGMTELALASQLSADQRDYLETVKSSAEGVVRVIDDLLDFEKIEAGQLKIENAPFDLERTIQTTLQALSIELRHKDLELTSEVAPGTPTLLAGDAARLRQVLIKLLGNAIKFTDAGSIGVEVSAEAADHHAALLHFCVRDTGIGIPPEQLEEIFQPHRRARPGRPGGVGLGLALCSRLVKAMGGRIWVVSDVGRGSTFHFTVRCGIVEEHTRPRVLLVEDQFIERRLLAGALTTSGFTVTAAASATQGLQFAASAELPFDVLVVESAMVSMSGLEFLRLARGLPGGAATGPALLICSEPPTNLDELRQAGVKLWLPKPLNPVQAVTAAEALLARPLHRERSSEAPSSSRPSRILVADDSPVSQKVAQRLLEREGHEVTVVSDGADALHLLEKQSFDLCLMDMHMPLVDGLEATMLIRQLEAAVSERRMPIVAMTANAMETHKEACLAAGMDDYLAKPVSHEELARVLHRWLPPGAPQETQGAP